MHSALAVALMPLSILCCVHRNAFGWAVQLTNIAPSPWEICTPSNKWFLGPTLVHPTNGISIGSAVFAGLTNMTNRKTEHATPSAAIGRI